MLWATQGALTAMANVVDSSDEMRISLIVTSLFH
jgi:hypothetical protein